MTRLSRGQLGSLPPSPHLSCSTLRGLACILPFSGFCCHQSLEPQQPSVASTVTAHRHQRSLTTDFWDGSDVGWKLPCGTVFSLVSGCLTLVCQSCHLTQSESTHPRWGLRTLSTTGPLQLRMITQQDPGGQIWEEESGLKVF